MQYEKSEGERDASKDRKASQVDVWKKDIQAAGTAEVKALK